MTEPITVLIVEDHRVLAEGLALALRRYSDLRVVGLAATIAQAVALAQATQPRVVLLDYYLPDGTGAEAAAALRRHAPATAVVTLTADDSDDALFASVKAGACGYLLKTQALDEVVQAVRRAAEGEMLIPAARLAGLLVRERERAHVETERQRLLGALTPREREVLGLMAKGLDNRAIAEHLIVSVTTVRWHVQRILQKLDAHSKLEAVARAARLGLLDQ